MNTIKIGKYKHYKGNIYQVIDIVINSETLEEFVLYRSLYDDCKKNTLWIRPFNMFVENVIIDGNAVPRFTFVEF